MIKATYKGNPEFQTEKEELEFVAKLLGCNPEQVESKQISQEKLDKLSDVIDEVDMGKEE